MRGHEGRSRASLGFARVSSSTPLRPVPDFAGPCMGAGAEPGRDRAISPKLEPILQPSDLHQRGRYPSARTIYVSPLRVFSHQRKAVRRSVVRWSERRVGAHAPWAPVVTMAYELTDHLELSVGLSRSVFWARSADQFNRGQGDRSAAFPHPDSEHSHGRKASCSGSTCGRSKSAPALSIRITSLGIQRTLQYRLGDHWVGALGVFFTVAGRNTQDAVFPNVSIY